MTFPEMSGVNKVSGTCTGIFVTIIRGSKEVEVCKTVEPTAEMT